MSWLSAKSADPITICPLEAVELVALLLLLSGLLPQAVSAKAATATTAAIIVVFLISFPLVRFRRLMIDVELFSLRLWD